MNTSQAPSRTTRRRARRRNRRTIQPVGAPRGGRTLSLQGCTSRVHTGRIDTQNEWTQMTGTTETSWTGSLLERPRDIRCIEIRTEIPLPAPAGNVSCGFRSGRDLFATWIHLHNYRSGVNRFEDSVFWLPEGLTGSETWWFQASNTVNLHWRVWRREPNVPGQGWVTNPATSMDLDDRGRG